MIRGLDHPDIDGFPLAAETAGLIMPILAHKSEYQLLFCSLASLSQPNSLHRMPIL